MESRLVQLRPFAVLASCVLIVAVLYWGQVVVIPLALAILLTFVLGPAVTLFRRFGLPRVAAVGVVVVLAFSLLAGLGWALVDQVGRLANDLPNYQSNIRQKISAVRGAGRGSLVEKVQSATDEVLGELREDESTLNKKDRPVRVEITGTSLLQQLPSSLLGGVASAGLVLVLVIFMLLEREELRNRFIRLIGYTRLAITTRALDEAGSRITRYLLMQSLVNAIYGLGVGIGLLLIGLPYALLWGFLAAVLRFIPFIGAWLGAALPVFTSLAVFSGWLRPLEVVGLYVVLELASNMLLEPLLYGQSAGVSPTALLVAVAFWTWLWGAVGLVLATPLTVCLVVLSKYVPELEFLFILMADEPVMEPDVRYYQRLVAADRDEATQVVEEYLGSHPVETVYDAILIPALIRASWDLDHQRLDDREVQAVVRATGEIIEEMAGRDGTGAHRADDGEGASSNATQGPGRVTILGCAARSPSDELALVALRRLLEPLGCEIELASSRLLSSELVAMVEERRFPLICIAGMPPGGLSATKYLCKRLRLRFPELRIVVHRSSSEDDDRSFANEILSAAGADLVCATLLETRDGLLRLAPSAPASC